MLQGLNDDIGAFQEALSDRLGNFVRNLTTTAAGLIIGGWRWCRRCRRCRPASSLAVPDSSPLVAPPCWHHPASQPSTAQLCWAAKRLLCLPACLPALPAPPLPLPPLPLLLPPQPSSGAGS